MHKRDVMSQRFFSFRRFACSVVKFSISFVQIWEWKMGLCFEGVMGCDVIVWFVPTASMFKVRRHNPVESRCRNYRCSNPRCHETYFFSLRVGRGRVSWRTFRICFELGIGWANQVSIHSTFLTFRFCKLISDFFFLFWKEEGVGRHIMGHHVLLSASVHLVMSLQK